MANFNFNKIILGGRLTGDPELKTTPSGISVTSFTVAVNSGPLPDSSLLQAGAHLLYQKLTQLCDDFDQMMKICDSLVQSK